ncbi:MAG: acyltransferase [Acidimicrobiia bacterium]|nr:acyltransferase [Acidimicrobiia bacterium]
MLAVVLFHLRLGAFSGGFVGVDVFFVLSGFLITRLLLGELAATGTVSLPVFWARRARRLLPASALVLVVTVVASRWMLSPLAQRAVATERWRPAGSASTSCSPTAWATTSGRSSASSNRRRCCTSGRSPWKSSSTCCGR